MELDRVPAVASGAIVTETVKRRLPRFTGLDLALIFNMALWGTNFVVSKAATDALPPMAFSALRYVVAAGSMALIMRIRRVDLYLPRAEWWPVFVSAIFGFVLYQPAFINGVHDTAVGNSVLILQAGPVWVVLFNAWRGEERMTRGTILGVLIALSGVLTVVIGRYAGQLSIDGLSLLGDGLIFLSSILWGISLITSRGPLARNHSFVPTFWLLMVGALSQVILGFPSLIGLPASAFTPAVIVAILYSGMISVTIGSLIFNHAIQKIGAARTAIYSYLQPFVAATLAIVVLHEAFTIWLVIGGLLIFVGVALVRRV